MRATRQGTRTRRAQARRGPVPIAVEIWTDGGCKPNPGPGGWGAILRFKDTERELSGADPVTTNTGWS